FMVYGGTLPPLTATFIGLLNGEPPAVVRGTVLGTVPAASQVGSYAITPSGGSNADYAISYVPGTLTITPDSTSVQVSSSANPSNYGQAVTFTAAVTANAPGSSTRTGTANFYEGSTLLDTRTLSGGVARLTVAKPAAGNHTITVRYSGDSNF